MLLQSYKSFDMGSVAGLIYICDKSLSVRTKCLTNLQLVRQTWSLQDTLVHCIVKSTSGCAAK